MTQPEHRWLSAPEGGPAHAFGVKWKGTGNPLFELRSVCKMVFRLDWSTEPSELPRCIFCLKRLKERKARTCRSSS